MPEIFNRGKSKEEKEKVEKVVETPFVHPNPHQDPVCAGCGKPINTIQVTDDFGVYHNQYCQSERINRKE